MITVGLIGGLGNQMFQYAFGRAKALDHSDDLMIDLSDYTEKNFRSYGLKNFNIVAKEGKGVSPGRFSRIFQNLLPLGWRKYVQYLSNQYNPKVDALGSDRYYLGYWQTEKYFIRHEEKIREELSIPLVLDGKNLDASENMKNQNAVSLHIRRGDYVTDPTANNRFGGICTLEYYNTAIKHIEEKVESPVFYIFSNDIPWAKENFHLENMVFVDWNGDDKNYEDIRLMSLCKHHIIANSSFSWWGAWLNPSKEKIVLAPSRWVSDNSDNTEDIVPESWTKI